MPILRANVHIELVDHDHGHWCNRCLLATGVRSWVSFRYDISMHIQERLYCPLCGGRDVTITDAPLRGCP